MRPMLAALVATAAIAIVAAVFAIWPAVGDAPWEDETPTPVPVVRQTECERLTELAAEARTELAARVLLIERQDLGC